MICAAQRKSANWIALRFGDRIVVTTTDGRRIVGVLDGFARTLGARWIRIVEREGWPPVYMELNDIERIERA